MGQLKFGRTYTLIVQVENEQTVTIRLPITLELDVSRNIQTSSYLCQLRLYNLGQKKRDRIRYNRGNLNEFRRVQLMAGYGTPNEVTIFDGNITQAWSVREGVNFITQIECMVGGYALVNARTAQLFPKGTPFKTVITTMIESLPYTEPGAIGLYPGFTSRASSYSGSTVDILRELTGGGFFIDNGKANALDTNEYIAAPNGITFVTPTSGLLNTPILESSIVSFDMLFEPGLNCGQRISLTSFTGQIFNGDYKCLEVKHRGVISEAVSGNLITSVKFAFTKLLVPATSPFPTKSPIA